MPILLGAPGEPEITYVRFATAHAGTHHRTGETEYLGWLRRTWRSQWSTKTI